MTPEEQETLIGEMEKDIDRLHALYNQYFMGIEKIEPLVVRKNLDRKINLLRREQIKNTALRFRMQMQIQKYNTQSTYWSRVCRQIEEGTYNRQVMLAHKRINARHANDGATDKSSQTDTLLSERLMEESSHTYTNIDVASFSIDLDDPFATNDHFDSLSKLLSEDSTISASAQKGFFRESMDLVDDPFADAARPPSSPNPPHVLKTAVDKRLPPPVPTGAKISVPKPAPQMSVPKPSSPKTASVMDEEQARSVYRRYLAARKKCNESVENISFETVAKSLNAKLQAENGKIDFKVVVRDGKAVIKTVKLSESAK